MAEMKLWHWWCLAAVLLATFAIAGWWVAFGAVFAVTFGMTFKAVLTVVIERWFDDARAEGLRLRAAHGDITAMQQLAKAGDPVYLDAMRGAISDVLGEEM